MPTIESILKREKPDFVQIDYSIDNREAEKRILPQAAGAAILTALVLDAQGCFAESTAKSPDWSRNLASSWAQFSEISAGRHVRHCCHSRHHGRRTHGE
jgi:hypothetical protein